MVRSADMRGGIYIGERRKPNAPSVGLWEQRLRSGAISIAHPFARAQVIRIVLG